VNLPKHLQYKHSGVNWLGQIPVHWYAAMLKRILLGISDGTHGTYTRVSSEFPLLSAKNVFNDGIRISGSESSISEEDHCQIVGSGYPRKGDLLVTSVGTIGRSFVYDREYPLAFQRSVCFIRLESKQYPQFYKYVVESKGFQEYLTSVANVSAQGGVYMGELCQALVPILPESEQKTIADFLDWKTGQIDGLISKKKLLIAKLKEKRIALITQAVTKGLNPDAPMRDSGIPWLGEVPEHWEVRRLKFTAIEPLRYGANESAECEDTNFPRYIRITDVREDGSLHSDTFRSLLPEVAEPFLLTDGDILLARSGATVGKSFQYSPDWGKAAYAGYLIRFRVDSSVLVPTFAYYFTKSQIYWANINSTLIQSTIQNFNAEKYGSINIPVPPLGEQNDIVKVISRKCLKIDSLSLAAQQVVDRLTEYRTALITAATTGKIDVCNVTSGGAT